MLIAASSYRFSHITKAFKALQSSTKTSLRIDDQGTLSLQFLMPSPKPRPAGGSDAFLEFRVCIFDNVAAFQLLTVVAVLASRRGLLICQIIVSGCYLGYCEGTYPYLQYVNSCIGALSCISACAQGYAGSNGR